MGLPFQKHLEWLCLEGMTDDDVRKFYSRIQLPLPTEKDVLEAREKVRKLPIPPLVRRNINRAKFIEEDSPTWDKLGYGDLHRWRVFSVKKSKSDLAKAWEQVGKILSHPVMRTSLDACMISRMEEEKIVLLLPQHYHLEFSEKALELYKRYFAGFENFSRDEWTDYLNRIREDGYVYIRIFTALTRPREEVLHLCGLPKEKQFSDFLRNVLATSSYKFEYYMRQNTPEGDHEARKWAKVGFEAGEKFEKFGAGDVSDFAKLVQTEFEYVTPSIDTINPETAQQIRPAIEGQVPNPDAPKPD